MSWANVISPQKVTLNLTERARQGNAINTLKACYAIDTVAGKANRGGQYPKVSPHCVRVDVDHRECESQGLSRFTALFIEAGT